MSSFKFFNCFDSISNVISIDKKTDDMYEYNTINILCEEFNFENNIKIQAKTKS